MCVCRFVDTFYTLARMLSATPNNKNNNVPLTHAHQITYTEKGAPQKRFFRGADRINGFSYKLDYDNPTIQRQQDEKRLSARSRSDDGKTDDTNTMITTQISNC